MKDKNKLIKIANKIVELEKLDTKEAQMQMEKVISNLSIDEMLKIDEYIYQKKLLTN